MKTANIGNRTSRTLSRRTRTCKTCVLCRVKKVKCCGTRPRCTECVNDELECIYPQDGRSEPRPSKTRLRTLEATITSMLDYMKASGIVSSELQPEQWITNNGAPGPTGGGHNAQSSFNAGPTSTQKTPATTSPVNATAASMIPARGTHAESRPAPTPAVTKFAEPNVDRQPEACIDTTSHRPSSRQALGTIYVSSTPNVQTTQAFSSSPEDHQHRTREEVGKSLSSLSPREASVAGILQEDGCISSVHGLTSLINHMPRAEAPNVLNTGIAQNAIIAATKARLISYAALQSQREDWIYNQPQIKIDFDGCDPDLAKHLIDLHFNRFHYAYLISYRPAIIDSIASGGGPWVNKLLLNAIYYSSSLFSDRPCIQEDSLDPQSVGARFCNRFFQLIGNELLRPSIPTAVALLLTSSSLVSHGRSSAGWNLSGLAYRMIIDLGCHLTFSPGGKTQANADFDGKTTVNDVEQEMRKRLYWGAYAIDATQALYLGRPCMFAPVESRVPMTYLDTFEELERWQPHYDPGTPSSHPPPYAPQPAYGVSTFGALIRLFQISTRIIKMYGIDIIKCETECVLHELEEVEQKLQQWVHWLPSHLYFDPEGPRIPPPHQIILQSVTHTRISVCKLTQRTVLHFMHSAYCFIEHFSRTGI